MKIYIAGKITGNDNYYIDFLQAEVDVKGKYKNSVILNPATTIARIRGLEHSEYLHICKAMIDVCEAVAFLPNWTESKGAKIEMEYANSKGKKIIYLEE
jgi:hypothetical protein